MDFASNFLFILYSSQHQPPDAQIIHFISQEDKQAVLCELQRTHRRHVAGPGGAEDQPRDQRQTSKILRISV